MKHKRVLITSFLIICLLCMSPAFSFSVHGSEASETSGELLEAYQDYQQRLSGITKRYEIETAGFQVISSQIFPIETECFGGVILIPALEKTYHRLAIFLAREDGTIVYATDQLEVNSRNKGQMEQPIQKLAAVSFQELDGDGKTDIVLIAICENKTGAYKGKPYKVGDVLFQNNQGFYRDYRISDKINRFSMNKSVDCITTFVRDGRSAEFLYTATTKKELLRNGFQITKELCYFRQFEKLGRLEVVPGTYTMANFATFMIYLIDEQGDIVWSFQPMGDYDNLYALKGMACRDIDGDGMKDLLVLARYSYEGNELLTESSYTIYYQRTGGFYEDTEIQKKYPCSDEDTVAELVERARAYWGWKAEE